MGVCTAQLTIVRIIVSRRPLRTKGSVSILVQLPIPLKVTAPRPSQFMKDSTTTPISGIIANIPNRTSAGAAYQTDGPLCNTVGLLLAGFETLELMASSLSSYLLLHCVNHLSVEFMASTNCSGVMVLRNTCSRLFSTACPWSLGRATSQESW